MLDRRRKSFQKFHWTRKRLRTENRLLRQRIDYLEQESSALADRLIKGQVNLAQEAENCMSISHELHKLRDINSDAHRRLEEAYDTIRELSCKKNDGCIDTATQVDDTSMIEHIHALQQELIETHVREADNENSIRDLKQRIQELELSNKRLKERPPDDGIAGLQEELISVKMREAEASLSLKEMRQRLAELEQQWTKYVQIRMTDGSATVRSVFERTTSTCNENPSASSNAENSPSPTPSQGSVGASQGQQQQSSPQLSSSAPQSARQRLAKLTASLIGVASADCTDGGSESVRELEDQLMGVRIREADTVAELKEMRQKVMELETQNHVCTNQLKRQDEELKRLREERDTSLQKEKEIKEQMRDERRKAIEAESELKEQSVMQRLKYSEAMQHIADLKQAIAHLELKKAEKWTHSQLRGSSVCDLDDESIGALGSRQSVTSGDALSIGSEDLTAIIADMTVRVPDLGDDILLAAVDEDGSATETEDRRAANKHKLIDEDGNDTTDSGLQMSDGL
uniref:Rab-GAP TBC domain-containing protein n=1 Tax=Parascaris univalens TaxID=6257 RepID=A0A915AZB0_PARUN